MARQCKTCRKKAHPTEVKAIRAALWSSRVFGAALRVYRCPDGDGWHLTTQPKREAAA